MSKRKKGKARQVDSEPPAPESPEGSDTDEARPAKRKTSNARNPSGRNQYAPVPPLEEIADRLREYHANNPRFKYKDYIAAFMSDHGISIGRSKLAEYLTKLGLSTTSRGNHMPESEKTQIILDELAKDPHQTRGPRVVKEILELAGNKIGRDDVSAVMHDFEGDGFQKRHPKRRKKIIRTPLTSIGPHEEWSMDGHDKLNRAGFGTYGIRDKWGGKFLHYRVLPSNRYAVVVGVVYLECVKKHGGIPVQGSSDRGSEVRDAHAFQTTLRLAAALAPDLLDTVIPAWMFLPSTRNITVESGWRPLFYTWGVNVLEFFESGLNDGFFEPGNIIHEQTSNWIWFPAIQRKQPSHPQTKNKILPSGGTPNEFCSNPTAYGGKDCLIPVDEDVIDQLLEEARAEAHEHMRYAYMALGEPEITLQNAWTVFRAMVDQLAQM
ncbi:hypothetical protein B0H14DRAFT_3025469 [Mycena olivaceomarginata]|nr:hypothetical protein B0H14DRAFT_3025469 [Mycena olivaceomarginata]